MELKLGERRIDRTRPERHRLCGDPIVKNVVLGEILTPASPANHLIKALLSGSKLGPF